MLFRSNARHPALVRGLAGHEGIGFVMVRSEQHGALAIGRKGIHFLADGRIVGEDPLAVFGAHAADNLRRLDGFTHVGDLLVNSFYDPSTEEIAPFEEQVGAHGGMGGAQTRAFILYPSALEEETKPVAVVGAEAVNALLHRWIARGRALHGEESPAAVPEPSVPTEMDEVLGASA